VDKLLSRNEIRERAAKFAAYWPSETREAAESQTFWNEFFDVFGVDRKRVARFEQAAERASTGNTGAIDMLWPGTIAVEHKSAGKSLEDADVQLRDYLQPLGDDDYPNYACTSDFVRIRITDLTEGRDARPYEFLVADLVSELDRFQFIAGYNQRKFSSEHQAEASVHAARLMGSLYEQLAASGYDTHDASILMTRLLFLMFGDDTVMWARGLFDEFVRTRTQPDGSDLGSELALLFQELDRPTDQRSQHLDEVVASFPYVNGGLFADRITIPSFDRRMRETLLTCCAFDWGAISPAVFGSMFQAIKSREARRALGEHYTTEENIMRVIEPLFLDELRQQFEESKDNFNALRRLHVKLGEMRFLDPACGCGNFLVIAYRELRALELDIILRIAELSRTEYRFLGHAALLVTLDHFHGIEIEEWPSRIAETAMFLTNHQANLALEAAVGLIPDELPLPSNRMIVNTNALRMDWADILPPSEDVIILGNPPFTGISNRSDEQTEDLKYAWGDKYNGYLDLVTGWHAKTMEYFGDLDARWAYVSTNSVCQGEQVAPLWQHLIDAGWRVRFAHRSFMWTSEAPSAAAVHTVIVGFDRNKGKARLFDYDGSGRGDSMERVVKRINPYLVDGPDVLVRPSTNPQFPALGRMVIGNKPVDWGNLIIKEADYDSVMADPHMAKYVHPYIGATELLYRKPRWCLWLVDLDPEDVRKSHGLKTRIEAVRAERLASRKVPTQASAATPHLFQQIRQPSTRYLGIPIHVGEARHFLPCAYFEAEVINGNHNFHMEDPDGFLFGVISSSMFLTWMKNIGGRLGASPRFANTLLWNTFPIPEPTDKQRADICAATADVLAVREKYPAKSLSDLYDPLAMTTDLVAAHRALDKVVDRVFGKRSTPTEAERFTLLLNRYAEHTGQNVLVFDD